MALLIVPTSRSGRGLVGHDLLAEIDLNIRQWRGVVDLARDLPGSDSDETAGPGRHRRRTVALVVVESAGIERSLVAKAQVRIHAAARWMGLDVEVILWPGERGHGATLGDLARRLSRSAAGIATVGLAFDELRYFADAASVPVWNGVSDQWHPLGVLGDIVAMTEAAALSSRRMSIAFLGSPQSPTANSLLIAAAMLGIELRVVGAGAPESDPLVLAAAQGIAAFTGARLLHIDSAEAGVDGAHFVYSAPGGIDLESRIPGLQDDVFQKARERCEVEAICAVLAATLGLTALGPWVPIAH